MNDGYLDISLDEGVMGDLQPAGIGGGSGNIDEGGNVANGFTGAIIQEEDWGLFI